jgi:DNA recombination protein RmuC
MEILYCAICLVVGAVVTGLIVAARYGAVLRFLTERKASLEAESGQWKTESAVAQAKVLALTAELATAKADLNNAVSRLTDYGKEVEQMQVRLKVEFENLANRVLEEKSSKFATQNQSNLEQLLTPLRQQMGEFKSRVDAVHTEDTADRAALRAQIESLTRASAEMTGEAKSLTLALKGDSKTQGNWGELILEKILESSGLTRDVEFTVQGALKNDEGANLRPDVLIHLPEGRHFVVDSKVSLTAYERYCNEADPEEQRKALREHVLSVRKHVEELAEKKYQDLYQITTPDFVFMFVPVEPAFSSALQSDRALFNDAFERKVILVTPSTLLATLRTVAHIWKQEKQTRNALDIAKRSGALYDKFVGLYGDLTEIGSKLHATTEAYHAALNKLKDGRGNLVKSVEDIKKLGARASKDLPRVLVQEASESDALAGEEEG